MHTLGWIMMIMSWVVILWLAGFCFWKILVTKKENIHAPLDIDTDDASKN